MYVNDYYRAGEPALACMEEPASGVSVYELDDNIVFSPENPRAGFIFYPGGKVQAEAYAPLMEACAERGVLCVLIRMPANLAVLDVDAADGTQEEFPEISEWYMGGHSLGGSMAASYLGDHTEEFKGLILLAAYSTEDLSDTDERVLSIYGSNDQVLNLEKYSENRENLSSDMEEKIIEGGNHAYFASYGEQDGDGNAEITNAEQIKITADLIENFIQ